MEDREKHEIILHYNKCTKSEFTGNKDYFYILKI